MTQNNPRENQDEIYEEFDIREHTREFIKKNQKLFDKLAQE